MSDEKFFSKKWFRKPIVLIAGAIFIGWLFFYRSGDSNSLFYMFVGSSIIYIIFWSAVIFGGIWLLRKLVNPRNRIKMRVGQHVYRIIKSKQKEQVAQTELDRIESFQKNFWNQLGSSREERDKNIKKIFESKDKTFTIGIRWDFIPDFFGYGGPFIQFCISRNLAAMESKEREFLKIAYQLFNNGKIDWDQLQYYCFAFINGNGKAAIDEYNYNWGMKEVNKNSYMTTFHQNSEYVYLIPGNAESIKDGASTVKFYQDKSDATVDSAINNLLKIIETERSVTSPDTDIHELTKGIYGGGAVLSKEEIEKSVFRESGEYKVIIGQLDGTSNYLHYSGEGSLMTIAPPRSGKSQCLVIPNMLNWRSSSLVLDISGELYEATSKWRSENIGPVYKFNPLNPGDSNCYNPLSFIRQDADYIWEDARFVAEMMIVPSGSADPFWENMARDVLTAAIAYITFYNEPEERSMSKVLDIIYGIGWDEMIVSLKTNVMVASMRRMGNSLGEIEKKQKDSILSTAQSSLSAWQGERIAKSTRQSDWNPLDLRTKGNITVYICIKPNEIDSYLSVLRVFIAQHVEILLNEKPPRGSFAPVLFMLDEFPRLKNMAIIDKALNAGAKYGIRLWMFAQSYGQLKESYQNAEGMLNSCAIQTYMNLPLNDELTTKISDQLGYRDGALDASRLKFAEPRDLAGPDYQDIVLVTGTNTKPAKVRKKFAYADPELIKKMKS